jgi:hypothetical protein
MMWAGDMVDEPADTDGPDWETAARTYVARCIENDMNRYTDRVHTITTDLKDGENMTPEAPDALWTAAITHQSTAADALMPIMTNDSEPEPELVDDAIELFQLLSQLIWTRRSDKQKLDPGLVVDVLGRLGKMDETLRQILQDETMQSNDEHPFHNISPTELEENFEPVDVEEMVDRFSDSLRTERKDN